jgi:hypothetical protein
MGMVMIERTKELEMVHTTSPDLSPAPDTQQQQQQQQIADGQQVSCRTLAGTEGDKQSSQTYLEPCCRQIQQLCGSYL